MTIHKPLREIPQQFIDNDVVTNIGSLNYETPKTEVHKLLQDHDFSLKIYWPNFEPGLDNSDLGTAVMGWYWVQFQRKEDAQRAKEVLNGTIVYGRRIKTGSIHPPKSSIPPCHSSHLQVPFTGFGRSNIFYHRDLQLNSEARTRHIKSDYAGRGLVIGPDLTQRLDKTFTPLSQSVPSPHQCNQNAWLQAFIQVVKRSGGKTEIKKILATDLPKFQAQGYSQYLHPGRPTAKPRDSDIRDIPKINAVYDTDNPVKSSANVFMTGMIASGLAVKVMPVEELVRTLPSKGLVELTIPMTEEEKQQVQQEKGPKYY
ncbi:hypothetical protein H9Q69_002233 [Fusarium xylarioides]|nr:hypothetical protein H9Q70_005961 [Fusarium xylarioides]KAG5798745.1 hypothetical protein H9Q69_002233 [Fusarium xylarioides]